MTDALTTGAERLVYSQPDSVDGSAWDQGHIDAIAADPGVKALVEQLIAMEMAEDVPSRWKIISHYNLRKWEHGDEGGAG